LYDDACLWDALKRAHLVDADEKLPRPPSSATRSDETLLLSPLTDTESDEALPLLPLSATQGDEILPLLPLTTTQSDQVVNRFGLDTPIDHDGSNLSVGQVWFSFSSYLVIDRFPAIIGILGTSFSPRSENPHPG
jgi:ABC-type multidrug transport system fused ATPase/permease subunit